MDIFLSRWIRSHHRASATHFYQEEQKSTLCGASVANAFRFDLAKLASGRKNTQSEAMDRQACLLGGNLFLDDTCRRSLGDIQHPQSYSLDTQLWRLYKQQLVPNRYHPGLVHSNCHGNILLRSPLPLPLHLSAARLSDADDSWSQSLHQALYFLHH